MRDLANAVWHKDITGPGITTGVEMEAADLGIVRYDSDRKAYAVMFGDNFSRVGLQGDWYSPSIVMYDKDFNVLGVPAIGAPVWYLPCPKPIIKMQKRSQLWPYNHDIDGPPGTFSTVLPTDFIRLDDGYWYVHVMVTRGLGHELWTEWQRSKDLVTWEWVSKHEPADHHRTMLTFEQFGGEIHILGTGGLARNESIYQWRCAPEDLTNWDKWIPTNNGAPVIVGGFGELCLRNVSGRAVLSYFDSWNYEMTARMQSDPTYPWNTALTMHYTNGIETPQCYGGYITPDSTPDNMGFIVSQWNTRTNDPYKCMLYRSAFASTS